MEDEEVYDVFVGYHDLARLNTYVGEFGELGTFEFTRLDREGEHTYGGVIVNIAGTDLPAQFVYTLHPRH